MTFLISEAFAAVEAPVTTQNSISNFILLSVLCVLFIYFFMWRPQNKRIKAHQSMMNDLQIGDEIMTNGGFLGKVTQIENSIVSLSIAENTIVKVQKTAISNILPKGTIK